MGDTSAVNEATLELFKRQIADGVTSMVRARLLATYVVAGSAVLAVLGVVGYGAIGAAKQEVLDKIAREIEQPAKTAADSANRALTNIEASRLTLEKLQDRSFKTFDNIDSKLADFGPKAEKLIEFTNQVSALDTTLQTIRTEAIRASGQNSKSIEELSSALTTLADQVKALNSTRQGQSATSENGENPPNSAVYSEIATKSEDVATKAQQVSSGIQRYQLRRTVWFQFAGITRTDAQSIAIKLSDNFTLPGEELTPKAAGLYEIRCFYENDCTDAEKQLGPALRASVVTVLKDSREPKIVDLRAWRAEKKPRQGTLEIWYSPPGP